MTARDEMTARNEMKARPVLIVDDNASNVRLMEAVLSLSGYQVDSAADAETALALLERWRPELILMDIQLPGIDGLELTKRLRRDPRYSKMPIVALTAYAMKGDQQRALEAGCDGYVAKPIDTRTFPTIVERFLSDCNVTGGRRGRRRARKAL